MTSHDREIRFLLGLTLLLEALELYEGAEKIRVKLNMLMKASEGRAA